MYDGLRRAPNVTAGEESEVGNVRSQIFLALILVAVLAGALGGLTGGQLQPPRYSATAYVVVYRMPAGLTDVINPGEAATLRSVYSAGVFQNAVIAKVLTYFPGLTADQLRQSVQIAVVAYSPLTRVVVSANDPKLAVALANSVSDNWAGLTQQLYDDTFLALQQRLESQQQSVEGQVTILETTIAAQQAARTRNPALLNALQAELAAAQQQEQDLTSALLVLPTYHDKGESLAYTAVRANLREVVTSSDTVKNMALGAAVGLTSGILLALWALWRARRPSRRVDRRDVAPSAASPVASPAKGLP
jgi:capsular polysaccharide biosynthesis protein